MVVLVGEDGDTDYEGFLGGVHKTVILQGLCSAAAPSRIRSGRSYPLEDVVAFDSPNIVRTEADSVELGLSKLGVLSR